MKSFNNNNQQLLDYLVSLSSELKKRGLLELSEMLGFAIGNASSMSTEFLGESRIALRQVLQQGREALTEQERDDVQGVLKQLDKAFDKR